jgi:hypothetical protein
VETRRRLAVKGFVQTAHYDTAISNYLDPHTPFQMQLYRCSIYGTGKTHTNRLSYTLISPMEGLWVGASCRAKSFRITTCSTWMPPGTPACPIPARRSPSSNTVALWHCFG